MKRFLVICLFLTAIIDGHLAEEKQSVPTSPDECSDCLPGLFDSKLKILCPKAANFECPQTDVAFWLSTKTHNVLTKLDSLSPSGPFVQGAPIKVLIDGYLMDLNTGFLNQDFRLAYFSRGDYNVISVDWSALCKWNCFLDAAASVPTVGFCLGQFLSILLQKYPGWFTGVHIIGTSLGAHIASWASSKMDQTVSRVTLLDPALPMFNDKSPRLVKAVASFVDVWHSNIGLFGRATPDGTVDIYLNNGKDQPGCKCDILCSHGRGMRLYAETINGREPFVAFPCAGTWEAYKKGQCQMPTPSVLTQFGEDFTPTASGVFQAFTKSAIPLLVPRDWYLDSTSFNSFKKTSDISCLGDRVVSFFSKHLV